MAKPGARGSRKKATLDYSYGEETPAATTTAAAAPSAAEQAGFDDDADELVVGSRKKMKDKQTKELERHERARAHQARREKAQKYLGYSDFLNSSECDSNGYRFDETDDFHKLDEAGWNRVVGFVLVRIVSPLILVVQGIVVGLVLWRVYDLDFSPTGVLAQQNCLPWVAGALSLNAFLVHGLSKHVFFCKSYYKPRASHGPSKT